MSRGHVLEAKGFHQFARFAVEQYPDPIYWLAEDGHILFANYAACQMIGYSFDELTSMKMYDVNEDLDAGNWPAIWGLLKASERRTFEARHRRKDGRLLEVEVIALFWGHDGGEYSCAVVREIGAQKARETRLRQAEKMEAVGRLAGGIAHDFNNQLAAILGYTEVLRLRMREDPAILDLIEQQKHVIEVAADLTSRLLTFSRPGKVVMAPVDLHQLIQAVVTIVTRSIDKQIQLEVSLGAVHSWTLGDASQLQSALLNLLLNARDAMPLGGTIRVETSNTTCDANNVGEFPAGLDTGEYVAITIADTGAGIVPEALDHVFEPFFTTKDGGGGLGLGLAVVYGTLRNHRGGVSVRSELERGSTFSLYLPVSRAPTRSRPRREEPASLRLQGHILLVDDEHAVRDATAKMLQGLGCTVTAFGDGQSALDYFRAEHLVVDVVMLDLMMPGLPSLDTLAGLQRIDPHVQVLLASGYSEDGQAQAMLAMGARAFMHKPFSMAALAGKVGALLPNLPR